MPFAEETALNQQRSVIDGDARHLRCGICLLPGTPITSHPPFTASNQQSIALDPHRHAPTISSAFILEERKANSKSVTDVLHRDKFDDSRVRPSNTEARVSTQSESSVMSLTLAPPPHFRDGFANASNHLSAEARQSSSSSSSSSSSQSLPTMVNSTDLTSLTAHVNAVKEEQNAVKTSHDTSEFNTDELLVQCQRCRVAVHLGL